MTLPEWPSTPEQTSQGCAYEATVVIIATVAALFLMVAVLQGLWAPYIILTLVAFNWIRISFLKAPKRGQWKWPDISKDND